MTLKTYRPSPVKMAFFIFAGGVLFTVLMLGSLFSQIIGLIVVLLTIYVSFTSKVYLSLSEKQITSNHFEKIKTLDWQEISEITDYRVWLSISGRNEEIKIMVNCLLENYAEIRDFVAKKRPDLLSE